MSHVTDAYQVSAHPAQCNKMQIYRWRSHYFSEPFFNKTARDCNAFLQGFVAIPTSNFIWNLSYRIC